MRQIGIDEVHDILFSILCDIDDFCRKEGLRWAMGYGTVLGAVRYGDFIPWDDDADIVMPREDFDRFVATYNGKYECILNTRREDVFYVAGVAKVHDPHTDKFVASRNKYICHYGVSVDIFPLDPVPDDQAAFETLVRKTIHAHRRLLYRSRKTGSPLLLLDSHFHSLDWWLERCDRLARSNKPEDCSRVAILLGTKSARNVHPKDFFEHLKPLSLRGREFPAPENTDSYLTQMYGPNYMTPPPVSERGGHGGEVWAL